MHKIHQLIVGGITTNCWIYPLDAESGACAIIDPGEEGSRIIAYLDQHKLSPQYILLTHGHFDHIAAVPALAAHYRGSGPSKEGGLPKGSLELAIHAADAEYLGPQAYPAHRRSFAMAAGDTAYLDALWEDMPAADRHLGEGDTVGSLTVLHLPGHTPGSIALWDKEAGVLFTGDTLFCRGYGRTDLPGGSEALLIASLQRLIAMDPGIRVHPGHGPSTTIGGEAAILR